jgi:phospholipid/cholesterol/gamma-HCH transport system substrate-binding protein
MADPDLADHVDGTLRNLQEASGELAGVARNARAILGEIRSGDGTAHELVYGQDGARLTSNLADATSEVAALMRDVRTGDGMMHDLVYERTGEEVMANVTAMSADLRAIVADIRAGRGTVGGLLVDPSIYEDVKRLVGNLQRNEILRALVRYSIRQDEAQGTPQVGEAPQ